MPAIDPESARRLTQHVIIVVIVILALYDIAIIRLGGPHASISIVVHEACRDHPVFACVTFFVLGHVFWPLVSPRR